jgi:lysophospholipase L1-like esterase
MNSSKEKIVGFVSIIAVFFAFSVSLFAQSSEPPEPMPVISRGVPAYASSGTPSYANDYNYTTLWRSSGSMPQWLAYDLSGVPEEQRGQVVVFWSSHNYGYVPYDPGNPTRYNLPGIYTIDVHAAPGGTTPPAASDPGWLTLAEVTSLNVFKSRQHAVNLTSGDTVYNWVRMRVTVVNGTTSNWDAAFNLDIHDVHLGIEDDWIFFGNSISTGAMSHEERGDKNFSQIIDSATEENFPLYQDGAVAGWTTNDAVDSVPGWIETFQGRYVGIAYGTNDAGWSIDTTVFYDNYETLVETALNEGKIPVIPTIPWLGTSAGVRVPPLNAKLAQLKENYPEILDGPDFWTFFSNNKNLMSADSIHPNAEGMIAYRRLWAEKMLEIVYGGSAIPENEIPDKYLLGQNYPNPFNTVTTFAFNLPSKSFVTLKIFDAVGREIETVISGELEKGRHKILWNAQKLSSGMYYYRIQAGIFTETRKLVIIR